MGKNIHLLLVLILPKEGPSQLRFISHLDILAASIVETYNFKVYLLTLLFCYLPNNKNFIMGKIYPLIFGSYLT